MYSEATLTFPAGLVVLAAGIAAGLIFLYRRRRRLSLADRIMVRFGLSPEQYRVLGADLGAYPHEYYVRCNGTHGAPDAVFANQDRSRIICGELKSRTYRGKITLYERYQVTLYLGALHQRFPRAHVVGKIRYKNRVVELQFDNDLYNHLIGLLPAFRRETRKFA